MKRRSAIKLKRTCRKITAVLSVAALLTSLSSYEIAAIEEIKSDIYGAGMDEIVPLGREHAFLDVDTFVVPPHLGEVRYTHRGDTGNFIVHIQDAHCNYYAHSRISEIIDYINREYGVSIVNLEGGAGAYDLSVFTDISGDEIRREVAEYFLKRGEVNGAEFYAINSPGTVSLWGVEDKGLYLKNLKVYRDSLHYREEVQGYLKELRRVFNNLKRHIFSPELLKIDMAYNAYKAGNMEFREYLSFLIKTAAGNGIPVKRFPDIYLIAQAMEKEPEVDFRRANTERSVLIDKLNGILSQAEMRELISTTVKFRTRRISRNEFYNYLLQKARECGMDTGDYPALSSYIVYTSLFDAVDQLGVMSDMDRLEKALKEIFFRNDTERELDVLSKNLALLGNIFELLLTKEDYAYYLSNISSFGVHGFKAFIEREAPRYRIPARLSPDVYRIDGYLAEISRFYEYSFKRDEAFMENMLFSLTPDGVNASIIMTGGFHTENLCALFREKGYSYVSIMPKFTSDGDYVNPYFDILAGRTADVQQMLRSALAQGSTLQIASKLNELGAAVWGREEIDIFSASVRVLEEILRQRGPGAIGYGISDITAEVEKDEKVEKGEDKVSLVVTFGLRNVIPVKIPVSSLLKARVSPAAAVLPAVTTPDHGPPATHTGYIASGLDDGETGIDGKTELGRWIEEAEISGDRVRPTTVRTVSSAAGDLLSRKEKIEEVVRGYYGDTEAGEIMARVTNALEVMSGTRDGQPGDVVMGWMRARAEITDKGVEKYLLGTQNAIAEDVIEYLSLYVNRGDLGIEEKRDLIQEYILHEVLENTALEHPDIIRATTNIFDRVQFASPGDTPLGKALRAFLDMKLTTAAASNVAMRLRREPNVTVSVIPVKGDQLLWGQNTLNKIRRDTGRVVSRNFGGDHHVYYYNVDAEGAELERELRNIMDNVGRIGNFPEDSSRVLVYADEASERAIRDMSEIKGLGDKLTGVIPGDFSAVGKTERIPLVYLAVLGMGFMEWDRAEGQPRQEDIARDTKDLFMRIVTNHEDIDTFVRTQNIRDENDFIRKLLSGEGDLIMRISRIDFNELRDMWEAEQMVLISL